MLINDQQYRSLTLWRTRTRKEQEEGVQETQCERECLALVFALRRSTRITDSDHPAPRTLTADSHLLLDRLLRLADLVPACHGDGRQVLAVRAALAGGHATDGLRNTLEVLGQLDLPEGLGDSARQKKSRLE